MSRTTPPATGDVLCPTAFLPALPSRSCDLPLHLLQLELDVVQQFLLPDNLLVEVCDAHGQVLVLSLPAADVADQLALLGAQLKQLLAALELLLLERIVLLDSLLEADLLSLRMTSILKREAIGAAAVQIHQVIRMHSHAPMTHTLSCSPKIAPLQSFGALDY